MKRKKWITSLIISIGCLFLAVAAFSLLLFSRVKKEYIAEVGQTVAAEDFKRFSWDKGSFIWLEEPDVSSVGEKQGKIQVFPINYKVTVLVTEPGAETSSSSNVEKQPTEAPIADTTSPEVTTQKITVYAEEYSAVTPERFITNINDESDCKVEMLPQPTVEVYGNVPYRFKVVDSAGNYTDVEAELFIINLKKSLVMELGEEVPAAEAFLYSPISEVSFVTDVGSINVMSEGSYDITLFVDGVEALSQLHIKDTTAPKLVLQTAETWLNKPLEASKFINYDETTDNSDAFAAEFVTEPDWSLEGEQKVFISAADDSGNCVTEETILLIKRDSKAPVVTVTDIDVKVGGTVSYKKAVSYYDDIDSKDEMKLSIERSGVNLKEVGTYEVTYSVTDCSGNTTSVIGKINVLNESPKWEDEEAIHEKAQGILDSILKDGMTDREKAKAIYKWIKNHIGYISHSEKGNYTRGAYEGLFKQQGDCFVYASTAKELLTLAGIQNIDIVKATTNPSHYWNLVYIEDGWYHFDSTPRKDKSEFFLLTDAELEAYSSTHKNTHIFDRSLYPEIQ